MNIIESTHTQKNVSLIQLEILQLNISLFFVCGRKLSVIRRLYSSNILTIYTENLGLISKYE